MPKQKRFFIQKVILISIAVGLFCFSHIGDPLSRIISGFASYVSELPQEKVYIQFDRPYYASGETIWFKAYLTAGAYHQPSPLSRALYVELIDENKQLVLHLKLFAVNGSAVGHLTIPDTLASGNYLIRSYTNWMRNSGEEYFFHRFIKIWNDQIPANITSERNDIDVQFFPEGGGLVNGIPGKVAFKAVGTDGLGRRVNGKILEEDNVVCEFKSNALGIGVFYLTPQKDKQYRAIIESYGKEIMLPKAAASGLAMSVNNSPTSNDILVKILTNDYTSIKTIYIVSQIRGVIYYSARADLTTNVAVARIPKIKIPSGIAQITVTDRHGIPLAERLVYVDQKDQIKLNVTTDKVSYAPGELVNLDIHATDADGNPIVADLSLSIIDNRQILIDKNGGRINTHLMLSSELAGHIESPGYYFNSGNSDREEALDHLLLTQGWRRFTFKDAWSQERGAPQYSVEQGLTIKGKMIDQHNNKPIIDGKVSYLSVYPVPETKTVRTNSKGEFEIADIIYFDSTDVMLQGETKRGSKFVKIIIDDSYDFPVVKYDWPALSGTQNESERAFIARSVERRKIDRAYEFVEKTITLEEVEIRARRGDIPHAGSRNFGRGSVNVKVSDNAALENQLHPLQLVQGRIAGVQVTGSGQNWRILIQGAGSINSGTTPLIMVDDIPVQIESLHTIPVQDIERFSVWKGADAAIFGARGANGAIGFYTKKGVNNLSSSGEKSLAFAGVGFQVERAFYAPRYDVPPEPIKPDKRATLFWCPYIQTDSSGRASISFYNHDVETTVTGTLEGISTTGNSGFVNFEYEIRDRAND